MRAAELASSVVRLEEIERRFQLLVESVTDYAIFMLDLSGTVVNWNLGAQRIKGYHRMKLLASTSLAFTRKRISKTACPTEPLKRRRGPASSRLKVGACERTVRGFGRVS